MPPSPPTPRPHQQTALADTLTTLRSHPRAQLVMPCGTGKTLVGAWAARSLDAGRVVVVVPSLALMGQTLTMWHAAGCAPLRQLAVCSDRTVTDDIRADEVPIPVTTDAATVAEFLRAAEGEPVLVVVTYHSAPELADAARAAGVVFDLLIADEAHRCAGQTDRAFATVLDDVALPARRRLFMTATPRLLTAKARARADDAGLAVASMDDEALFGPVAHNLSFADAVGDGLLVDYEVVVVGAHDRGYTRLVRSGAPIVAADGSQVDPRQAATATALLDAAEQLEVGSAISFHTTVAAARRFTVALDAVHLRRSRTATGPLALAAGHVNGKMNAQSRLAHLEQLADRQPGRVTVITNARVLTEGVDVPAVDAVVFADPKSSQVDIVQAIGRAMRPAPGKHRAVVIVPVLVDGSVPAERALAASSFRHVWEVVRALQAYDGRLASDLDELRRLRTTGSEPDTAALPKRLSLALPTSVSDVFFRAFAAKLVEQVSTGFDLGLAELDRYLADHGHAAPPTAHITETGFPLGQWVVVRRYEHRRGRLATDRAEALEQRPGWVWDAKDARWQRYLAALHAFAAEHGHSQVPSLHVTGTGLHLGTWVSSIRSQHAAGTLPDSRRAALETLPGWSWNTIADRWEANFAALEAALRQRANPRIPRDMVGPDGQRLGAWASKQRAAYARGVLSSDRARRLEQLPGWSWDAGDLFDHGYAQLRAYVEAHGTAAVPWRHITDDGFNLGAWAQNRRMMRANGQLSDERAALLEQLPGWSWNRDEDRWHAGYEAYCRFVAEHGHGLVPVDHVDGTGYKVGQWTVTQRNHRARGRLRQDRIALLDETPGWAWNAADERFWLCHAAAERFLDTHGYLRVPANVTTIVGTKLSAWISNTKKRASSGSLADDQADAFASLLARAAAGRSGSEG